MVKRLFRTGSVYQRKSDGRWVASVSAGSRANRKVTMRYARTQEEAEVKLAEIQSPYMTDSERFWAKVLFGPECWAWNSVTGNHGRGLFRVGGRWVIAPRFAYEDKVAPIPVGHYVLHRCDNPNCVKPLHLFTGTQADNMADASAKGRLGLTDTVTRTGRRAEWQEMVGTGEN